MLILTIRNAIQQLLKSIPGTSETFNRIYIISLDFQTATICIFFYIIFQKVRLNEWILVSVKKKKGTKTLQHMHISM